MVKTQRNRIIITDLVAGLLFGTMFPMLAWHYDRPANNLAFTLDGLVELHRITLVVLWV